MSKVFDLIKSVEIEKRLNKELQEKEGEIQKEAEKIHEDYTTRIEQKKQELNDLIEEHNKKVQEELDKAKEAKDAVRVSVLAKSGILNTSRWAVGVNNLNDVAYLIPFNTDEELHAMQTNNLEGIRCIRTDNAKIVKVKPCFFDKPIQETEEPGSYLK